MADDAAATGPLPVVPYLKIPASGEPHLEAQQCSGCGKIFLSERNTCSEAREIANTRGSFPGIKVPYVSAVVDMDGGGTVKGNLINIDPDPEKIRMGMPVEVIYQKAPTTDADGNEYLTYYFQPAA